MASQVSKPCETTIIIIIMMLQRWLCLIPLPGASHALPFVTFLKALFNRSTKTRRKYVAERHAWSFHGLKLLHKVQSLKWHSIVVFVNGYSMASSCKLHLLTNRRQNRGQRKEGFVLQRTVRERALTLALGSANHPITNNNDIYNTLTLRVIVLSSACAQHNYICMLHFIHDNSNNVFIVYAHDTCIRTCACNESVTQMARPYLFNSIHVTTHTHSQRANVSAH